MSCKVALHLYILTSLSLEPFDRLEQRRAFDPELSRHLLYSFVLSLGQ